MSVHGTPFFSFFFFFLPFSVNCMGRGERFSLVFVLRALW